MTVERGARDRARRVCYSPKRYCFDLVTACEGIWLRLQNRAAEGGAPRPVNRRTTSVTWGKHASGFDGSFKRTKYGYPSASARLAMQAESSLWGRKRVVGSKLKHDGTLGYISRGAARRSGLNPAGWHRYVPIVAAVAVIVIALAALGYAGGGANLDAMFKSPELAHAGTEVIEGAQTQTGVAPQRGIVAAASTIADAQKDEDEQGSEAETAQTNETTTTQIST